MPALIFKNSKTKAEYVLDAVDTAHLDAVIASLTDDGWSLESVDGEKPTPKNLTAVTKEI